MTTNPPVTMTDDERARVQAAIWTGVAAAEASRGRRERRRAAMAPALLVACAASVVLGLVFVSVHPASSHRVTSGRPVVASVEAVQALDRAARNVATTHVAPPTPDQLVYTRSISVSNEGRLGGPVDLGTRHVREIWLSQDPGATRDGGLIRELGQDWPLEGGSAVAAGLRRPTYAYLASLPSDPDRLLDTLESQLPAWDDARSRDQVLFDAMLNMVREQLAPPETMAAVFQALTRIPGVVVDSGAHDLLGRPGVGISRTEDVFLTREVMILDPRTGQVLGSRSYQDGPGGAEVLFGADAVVDQAVVDRAGQAPAARRTDS